MPLDDPSDQPDNVSDAAPTQGGDDLPTPCADGLPTLSPDHVEQEKGEDTDNVIPTGGFARLPVVGLGGSAGGLSALQAFFGAMPPDCGMAFVVILHLSPEHDSVLAEVLQRWTMMPVRQVRDRVRVEANQVYVIPPGKHLSITDSHLHLSDFSRGTPGHHITVDVFFRALADTNGAHCAAVVLSGADGDGAIGIKRVKERGGLTVTQDPGEAEQDSMPRSAIATGMVDWVLPAAEMPARLCQYWNTEKRLRLPPEAGPQPARESTTPATDEEPPGDSAETALHDVLAFLRARTGRDFTYYKRATILRRVARRMQVNGIEDMPHYLGFLRTHPGELGALLQDLLISVTNFFRDREAFAAFEAAVPGLFRGKGPKDTVRVWCAACATGEEAYSVAMLLCEHADTLDHPPLIQVFATDLDENAIAQARDGSYPETITADVREERLRRFFNKGHGKYRVRREVREMVLFALHDLLKDSPFSKLDAVTCRNLLIYLTRDAQDRALDIFHFSLKQDGILFLGTSESVDDQSTLFTVSDKKYRLYARRATSRTAVLPLFVLPTTQTQPLPRLPLNDPTPPRTPGLAGSAPRRPTPVAGGEAASWAEVHAQAIEHYGAASVIIDSQHRLVRLSGRAGRLMQFNDGELTTDLLRVVHPMLRLELRAAIFRAEQTGEVAEVFGLPVDIDGAAYAVDVRVAPVLIGAPGFLLVIFAERRFMPGGTPHLPGAGGEPEPAVRELERELEQAKFQLRATIEQSEANQEELKASNEELQAMNEELRSTSEELETGREELQSINEELTTVNQEMKSKVEELARSNSDLQNLMASTHIATIFLDRMLCIQRYTPPAVSLFSLIPTDVGRPLADLTSRVNYPNLSADAQRVLDDLSVAELEVTHRDGRHFLARMRPYRTEDDRIAGVVLTFVDISVRKEAETALRANEEQFRSFVAVTSDSIYKMSADWSEMRHLEGKRFLADTPDPSRTWLEAYIPPEDRPIVRTAIRDAIRYRRLFELEHRVVRADGSVGWTLSRAIPLLDIDGEIKEWFGAAQNVTKRRNAEEGLRTSLQETEQARTEADTANAAKDQFLAVLSHELRTPLMPITLALAALARRQDLPEAVRNAHAMIKRNVELEARFIDDMLDVTRIARGKMEVVCADIDLHEAIQRAVEVSLPDLEAKSQPLTLVLEAGEHRLNGDFARLQQVFWNLLKNASKFTPRGGAIRLRTHNDQPGWIAVQVADSGIGLEAEAIGRIFRPFEQADARITQQFGGLGLGLAIAKATVETHGGTLHASSPGPGQGATFTVAVPLSIAAGEIGPTAN